MNFVTRKSRKYFLTSEGDKFVENVINSKERSLHDKIKETIFKLGSYYNLYCEREYMMEHSDVTQKKEYFDVAWKRDIKGDPTMVFEVHLEGDPFEALSKLSLAYGTWKSEPYLIISSEDKKTRKIALTHFAPLNNVIKILTLEELDQWYNRMKLADNETRRHVGIGVRLTLKAKKIKKNLNDDLPDT